MSFASTQRLTTAGAKEYKYVARRGAKMDRSTRAFERSYVGKKLARFGHERPLVLSGLSEKLSRVRDIRVTAKRGRAILPQGFNRRYAKSRVNMREEITTVSKREETELIRQADKSVGRKLAMFRNNSSKKLA